jgi:hypothetical protein
MITKKIKQLLFIRHASSLIIIFNPSYNVASCNMNRQIGVLPKKPWSFHYYSINNYLICIPNKTGHNLTKNNNI